MVPKLFTVHACGAVFGGDRKCVNKTVTMKAKLCDRSSGKECFSLLMSVVNTHN